MTYGASGYIETHAGGSALKISTFTRTEKTADAIRAALEVAERLRMETFTAEELADSRNSLLGSFQMGLETPSQIAARWWDLVVWGVPEDWYGGYLKAIAGIESTSLLSETARRYLDPATMSIVVVGKAADVAPQLAPFGTLTTRPAE